MTGTANNTALCEKLSARFERRGVKNPNVIMKVSLEKERARREREREAQKASAKPAAKKIEPGFTSAKKRLSGRDYKRHSCDSFAAEQHDFVPDGGNFGLAFEKGTRIRARAAAFNPAAYERRNPEAARRERKQNSNITKVEKTPFKEVLKDRWRAMLPNRADVKAAPNERIVRKTSIPKGIVASILLCTVLLMFVLYTYSSYTEAVTEGKKLQNEQVSLLLERDKLVNLLELRDDVRDIEDYAVNTLGMVKSDLVENRYVKIAGGERIEVISADEPEEGGGFFATILSVMGTNWERLLEYFD